MQSAFNATPQSFGYSTLDPQVGEMDSVLTSNGSLTLRGNTSHLDTENVPQNKPFSSSTSVILAMLMTLLVFATVMGNALVILAFVVEKSLRTQGNFFFLNLAIADFLVGKCHF